jgi:hypothetical protein
MNVAIINDKSAMTHLGNLTEQKLPQLTRRTTNYDNFYETKMDMRMRQRSFAENATRWHERTKFESRGYITELESQ